MSGCKDLRALFARGKIYMPNKLDLIEMQVKALFTHDYEMNRIPTYSNSWDNAASQSVARKLKCDLYGVHLSIY